MSDEPVIAQKAPFALDVTEGRTYYWCACGRTKNEPLCDGSHKGTSFSPIPHTAKKDGTLYLCGCKHSKAPPLCDGAHMDLK